MKIKISATFEGKCLRCKKEKMVFSAGNEESGKVITLCQDCCKELGDISTANAIEKYGIKNDDAFSNDGINVTGLDKIQKKIDKIKKESKNNDNRDDVK